MSTAKQGKGRLQILVAGLVSASLACMLALSGCGSSSSATKATLSESVSSDTAMARVESVDGNTITLSIMDGQGGPGGAPNDGAPNGTPPSGEAPNGTPPNGTPPNGAPSNGSDSSASAESSDSSASSSSANSKPDDAESAGDSSAKESSSSKPESGSDSASAPAAPNGQAPNAPEGGPQGTEATLSVSDASIIYTSSNGSEAQGSLDDIKQGSMLTLSVSNGTEVTKVVVGGDMPGGTPPDNAGQAPDQNTADQNAGSSSSKSSSSNDSSSGSGKSSSSSS